MNRTSNVKEVENRLLDKVEAAKDAIQKACADRFETQKKFRVVDSNVKGSFDILLHCLMMGQKETTGML